ncbi:hypothetical protein K438DRAFT_1965866 [Mycena galopus ATCC 62051]|nr:hypothetical protein K438DRAFT_1965866 [Mycena galopus ATCC 62051]
MALYTSFSKGPSLLILPRSRSYTGTHQATAAARSGIADILSSAGAEVAAGQKNAAGKDVTSVRKAAHSVRSAARPGLGSLDALCVFVDSCFFGECVGMEGEKSGVREEGVGSSSNLLPSTGALTRPPPTPTACALNPRALHGLRALPDKLQRVEGDARLPSCSVPQTAVVVDVKHPHQRSPLLAGVMSATSAQKSFAAPLYASLSSPVPRAIWSISRSSAPELSGGKLVRSFSDEKARVFSYPGLATRAIHTQMAPVLLHEDLPLSPRMPTRNPLGVTNADDSRAQRMNRDVLKPVSDSVGMVYVFCSRNC